MTRDFTAAFRRLAKAPVYTISAVGVLAVGTCLATATFAIISAGILRRPPIPSRDQMVRLYTGEVSGPRAFGRTSLPDFRDLATLTTDAFAGLVFSASLTARLGDAQEGEFVSASFISGNYFQVVQPPLQTGRGILPDDETSQASVVVVSHRFWRTRMAGTKSPLAQQLILGGHPFRVIGIVAQGFRGVEPSAGTELWLPYAAQGTAAGSDYILHNRDAYVGAVFARLRPTVTLPQAEARVQHAASILASTEPAFNQFRSATLRSLEATLVAPASTRYTLLLSLAVVVFVHLIACSNLSTLVLVRIQQRRKDSALRLALGATPRRVLWESLLKPLLITAVAGTVALICYPLVTRWLESQPLLRALDLTPDPEVFLFGGGFSAVTAALVGILPAVRASNASIRPALSLNEPTATPASGPDHLVTLQTALALALLYLFSLVTHSLQALRSIEPGYDVDRLLFVHLSQAKGDFRDPQWLAFYQTVIQGAGQIPGVRSVSVAQDLPLRGWFMRKPITVPGYQYATTEPHDVDFDNIGPQYFSTMGIPILKGREFSLQDPVTPPHALSQVIVNEAFAKHYWPDTDPIGKPLLFGTITASVIGVVADARFTKLAENPEPRYFITLLQPVFELVVRTEGDPESVIPNLRAVLGRYTDLLEAPSFQTVANSKERSLTPLAVASEASGLFAMFALVLTCIGLFGQITLLVQQRYHEYGIRLALGASPTSNGLRVLTGVTKTLLLGLGVGIPLAFLLANLATPYLFDVEEVASDAMITSTLTLCVVGLAATLYPAWRASKADPLELMRSE